MRVEALDWPARRDAGTTVSSRNARLPTRWGPAARFFAKNVSPARFLNAQTLSGFESLLDKKHSTHFCGGSVKEFSQKGLQTLM